MGSPRTFIGHIPAIRPGGGISRQRCGSSKKRAWIPTDPLCTESRKEAGVITYKGYGGQVDFDADAEVFGGTVVNANVLMSFEGKTVAELRKSFRDVVDTYLADCKAAGKQPEKPYNGTIIVRVDPEIHRRVALKAAASRKSMNKYIQSLLEKATEDFAAKP
jgi:predicted HicB family RNase H-like nuclease